jgi:hypothetical protein
MKKDQIVGLTLFIGGIILIYLYTTFQALQNIDLASIPVIIGIGVLAVIIGIILLLISVLFEQKSDMKKRREEIKKEDFEP